MTPRKPTFARATGTGVATQVKLLSAQPWTVPVEFEDDPGAAVGAGVGNGVDVGVAVGLIVASRVGVGVVVGTAVGAGVGVGETT